MLSILHIDCTMRYGTVLMLSVLIMEVEAVEPTVGAEFALPDTLVMLVYLHGGGEGIVNQS